MREIKSHQFDAQDTSVRLFATGDPGPGGAPLSYTLSTSLNKNTQEIAKLRFQNGPVKDNAANGLTDEALIAVVIDRLQQFQKGPCSCRENALAITKLEEAQHWLHHRTRDRKARGVEGQVVA